MATKPDTQTTEVAQAVAEQPELLGLDEACQRLSETVGSPEGLSGFYSVSGNLPKAALPDWRDRYAEVAARAPLGIRGRLRSAVTTGGGVAALRSTVTGGGGGPGGAAGPPAVGAGPAGPSPLGIAASNPSA